MPQFDASHFPAEIFWTIISFLLLFLLLRRWVLPRILNALEARTQAIRDEIEAARKTREEAEALHRDYRHRLAGVEEEVRRMFDEADARIRAERERRMQEWKDELKRREAAFQEELHIEKNRAVRELREHAAEFVTLATERVLRHAVDRRELDRLARQALDELEGKAPTDNGPTIH